MSRFVCFRDDQADLILNVVPIAIGTTFKINQRVMAEGPKIFVSQTRIKMDDKKKVIEVIRGY